MGDFWYNIRRIDKAGKCPRNKNEKGKNEKENNTNIAL